MPLLVRRDTKAGGIVIKSNLHSAAALGAMVLLFTMHRAIMSSGFQLSRRIVSTDILISFALVALGIVWTELVFISGFMVGEKPCTALGPQQCLGRLAYA